MKFDFKLPPGLVNFKLPPGVVESTQAITAVAIPLFPITAFLERLLADHKRADEIVSLLKSDAALSDIHKIEPVSGSVLMMVLSSFNDEFKLKYRKGLREMLRKHRKNAAIKKSLIARNAVNSRHDKPGGSREKREQLVAIWRSGKYTTKEKCAYQEHEGLGMSYEWAKKALRNM